MFGNLVSALKFSKIHEWYVASFQDGHVLDFFSICWSKEWAVIRYYVEFLGWKCIEIHQKVV